MMGKKELNLLVVYSIRGENMKKLLLLYRTEIVKYTLLITLFLLLPSIKGYCAFPQTGILDDFNRTNEGPPPSASWTDVFNGLKVVSNVCVGNSSLDYNVDNWNTQPGNDQEAYLTITNAGATGAKLYLQIRSSGTDSDGYSLEFLKLAGTDTLMLNDYATGTIISGSSIIDQEISAGDSFGISAIGSTVTAYYKASGGSWTAITSGTDTTYTSGKISLAIKFNTITIDDFGGGTVVAATGSLLNNCVINNAVIQ